MGNSTSAPSHRVVAHKIALGDTMPHNSVLQSVHLQTFNHTIHSICLELEKPVGIRTCPKDTHAMTVKLFGVEDFPVFLLDSKQPLSLTVMLSITDSKPLDLKVEPKFRPVTPEEYSMLRKTDIVYPIGDFSWLGSSVTSANLVFRSSMDGGKLVIGGV
jgi:hypothetical protein